MSLPTIAVDRIAPQPWRNGGGRTRELLAWPDPAHWQLRISVADIERDGPFSPFPGVDRGFAVVEGAGVRLHLGGRAVVLTPDSAPLAFDGAAAPACELLGGATRDLNLMTRHDAGRGELLRARVGAEWLSAAPLRALFTAEALTLQIDDTDAARLAPWTLLWSDHAARQRWRIAADHLHDGDSPRAWWLGFAPRPA